MADRHRRAWQDRGPRQESLGSSPWWIRLPTIYTTTIEHVRPTILEGPPHGNKVWGHDPGDIIQDGWLGKTAIDLDTLQECTPHERVYIEVWDES